MVMSRTARECWSGLWTLFREKDGAGAGAEGGLGLNEGLEEVEEATALQVLEEGGGLAAGDDEGVDFGELLGLADQECAGAQVAEALGMGLKRTLQGEDADEGSGGDRCRSGHG